jgi:hypothetical protein
LSMSLCLDKRIEKQLRSLPGNNVKFNFQKSNSQH